MKRYKLAIVALALALPLLGGCTAAVIGGAAAGASAVHDRRTTGSVIEDQEIELNAMKLMSNHPEIDDVTNIQVISFNQRVLLVGQAQEMESARRYAELMARQPKVRAVYNEVEEGARSDWIDYTEDSYLTTKVKLSLFSVELPDFDPTRVKVVTSVDKVYLMGLLTRQEASAVIDKVRGIKGVKKVVDIFEYVDS